MISACGVPAIYSHTDRGTIVFKDDMTVDRLGISRKEDLNPAYIKVKTRLAQHIVGEPLFLETTLKIKKLNSFRL